MLLAIPIAGCPLDLPFPLGEPGTGSLDAALEGRWGWSDAKKGEEGDFTFSKFNASEYVVVGREKGKEPILLFRAFTTKVGAATYLNVCELKPGKEPSYLYARYTVKGDELSFRIVEEMASGLSDYMDRKGYATIDHETLLYDTLWVGKTTSFGKQCLMVQAQSALDSKEFKRFQVDMAKAATGHAGAHLNAQADLNALIDLLLPNQAAAKAGIVATLNARSQPGWLADHLGVIA